MICYSCIAHTTLAMLQLIRLWLRSLILPHSTFSILDAVSTTKTKINWLSYYYCMMCCVQREASCRRLPKLPITSSSTSHQTTSTGQEQFIVIRILLHQVELTICHFGNRTCKFKCLSIYIYIIYNHASTWPLYLHLCQLIPFLFGSIQLIPTNSSMDIKAKSGQTYATHERLVN